MLKFSKRAIEFKSNQEVELLDTNYIEPNMDVAQIAHVEILSPKPQDSIDFFHRILGMDVVHQEGQSVYMRAYEDTYHNTLKITESNEAGLGHAAWRARSPQALLRRVEALKKSGLGLGWIEGDIGHGAAYQFQTPDGHRMEILWDQDYYAPPEYKRTLLLNRAQKRPDRGVPVRRLDHINLMNSDTKKNSDFMMDVLGMRLTEQIASDGELLGTWLSVSNIVHELAFMVDPSETKGRLHHICYWYGTPQNLFDVADLCKENNIHVELGPRKHSISQAFCLYVYEPGGNRIELFGDAGYLIFDPTWEAPQWSDLQTVSDRGVGAGFTESYWNYGTPNVKVPVKS